MALLKDEDDGIFKEILLNFSALSKTEKGLNVIKKFISFLSCEAAQRQVVKEIGKWYIDFIENPYSNYATQIIIKGWSASVTAPLFPLILGKIERFSTQRVASNVVEVMLEHSPIPIRREYFKEIASIKPLHSNSINRNHSEHIWKLCHSEMPISNGGR
jgi:hypothetical protein